MANGAEPPSSREAQPIQVSECIIGLPTTVALNALQLLGAWEKTLLMIFTLESGTEKDSIGYECVNRLKQ